MNERVRSQEDALILLHCQAWSGQQLRHANKRTHASSPFLLR